MKAPLCLALALSLGGWPDPPPRSSLCPDGPPVAYLGYRQGELIAVLAQPARISLTRGLCGSSDRGNLEWDPRQRRAFRCESAGWYPYLGVNTILRVEGGRLEEVD